MAGSAPGSRSSRRSRSSSIRGGGRRECMCRARCGSSCPTQTSSCRPGDGPLVVVAPSTAQDPDGRLVRAALDALADEPVRVLATTNRRPAGRRSAAARERGGGRLAQLFPGVRGGGPGRVPRGPRDGGEGARRRGAGDLLPGGWRHGRERRAGRVGGRRRDVAVATGRAGEPPGGGTPGPESSRRTASARGDRALGSGERRSGAGGGAGRAARGGVTVGRRTV